jgi:hypothetical protein
LVDCPECGAIPYHRCTSLNGSGRNPHGKRTARLHGLKATPQRGSFVPPKSGILYREDEVKACEERGIQLPMKADRS